MKRLISWGVMAVLMGILDSGALWLIWKAWAISEPTMDELVRWRKSTFAMFLLSPAACVMILGWLRELCQVQVSREKKTGNG